MDYEKAYKNAFKWASGIYTDAVGAVIEKAIWYLNDYKKNFLMPYAETFNHSLKEEL